MSVTQDPRSTPRAAPKAKDGSAAVTVGRLLEICAGRLRAAGVPEPRRDARLLLAAAVRKGSRAGPIQAERPLTGAECARVEALVERRSRREPVSRILGRREFWSLELRITPDTLDPRPDSETVVEAVLARIPERSAPLRVLDLGTGSGCLLLALLTELPAARGLGTDLSAAALSVARENARALGLARRVRFVQNCWGEDLEPGWQVIVSNPPYITDADIPRLAPEVAAYDPRLALAGGPDGLDAYRGLLPHAARLIAPGGLLALEVGGGQGRAVDALIRAAGFRSVASALDLGGHVRCLVAVAATGALGKKVVGKGQVPD